jgi:DNA polymerase-1
MTTLEASPTPSSSTLEIASKPSVTLFDLESDGLLDAITKIHCICLTDPDNPLAEIEAYHDALHLLPKHGTLQEGLQKLESAEVLAGHNITEFDLPAIKKVRGTAPRKTVEDTAVWSRLCFSDRKEQDYKLSDRGAIPKSIIGKHSLKSWGIRLGLHKGEYTGDFQTLDQDMLDYCIQDVRVNVKLYHHLKDLLPSPETAAFEQWFAEFCYGLTEYGVPFDVGASRELLGRLLVRRAELDDLLHVAFPPRKEMYAVNKKTGKQVFMTDPTTGEKRDHKLIPFNPGSRPELAERLIEKYGWQPTKWTKSGDVEMVEATLLELGSQYPEAKLAAERYIVQARIGILQEGKGSYLNQLDEFNRIHGRVLHIGAVTHRCSHSKPNLGNPTSVRKPYGLEMRRLFVPVPGYEFAGVDASSLELAILGHYLGKWDDGVYAETVFSGDPHTLHRVAILDGSGIILTRDETKTAGYAWLYGAGDAKLGRIAKGGKSAGAKIRGALRSRITGLDPLLRLLEAKVSSPGSVFSLDGRRIGIRHAHAALNSLLQGGGAVVMRWFPYFLKRRCQELGIVWGRDYIPHLHVHDEIQGSLKLGLRDKFREACNMTFQDVTAHLRLRCKLKGEVKFGNNWAETH